RERRSTRSAAARRQVRVQRRAAPQHRAAARRVGADARQSWMSFPIGLSNGPPPGSKAPNGRNGLAEVAAAGVTFIRTGRADWSAQQIDAQIAAERTQLDAAGAHGLHGWLWLGDLPDLPAGTTSPEAKLLSAVADGVQGHAALLAYKGIDEPRNPFRGANWIRPAG